MHPIKKAVLALGITLAPALAAAQSAVVCGQTYTVAPGATLSKISTSAYSVSAFGILVEANKSTLGDNPNLLFVGQKLVIPCRDTAPAVAATEAKSTPVPATPTDGEPVVLTFNKASDPRFVINAMIVDPFLKQVEIATDGRVRFVEPAEVNINPSAQFELVTSGAVDGAYAFNGYLEQSHPLLQMPMIPLMGGAAEQTAVSLWNLHDEYLSKTEYFDDAHLLGFISAPTAHIWHRLDRSIQAGQSIASVNNYPVPYFEGLDTVGPKRVQTLNAMRYGSHDEAKDGPLTFMMAHGPWRGAWCGHLERRARRYQGREWHLHAYVFGHPLK